MSHSPQKLTAETTPALRYDGVLSGWRYSPNGPGTHEVDCLWFETEEDALDFHRGFAAGEEVES